MPHKSAGTRLRAPKGQKNIKTTPTGLTYYYRINQNHNEDLNKEKAPGGPERGALSHPGGKGGRPRVGSHRGMRGWGE
jgi:hypothetical protein